MEAVVLSVPMSSPDDVSGVAALFDSGIADARDLVAVMAQTEGDGHARGYCSQTLALLLSSRLDVPLDRVHARVPMLIIGGTAGLMSPHFVLFFRPSGSPATASTGLRIGVARSRRLDEAEIGTESAIGASAEAVRAAMDDAGGLAPQDVVCVEMKCPQGSGSAELGARSRAAAALGAALSLGEVEAVAARSALADRRADVFSTKASTSSGTELDDVRVVVIGNGGSGGGQIRAAGGVMRDPLDLAGAQAAFRGAGLPLVDGVVPDAERGRILAVLVNAGADGAPSCRGARHVMHTDLLGGHSGHLAKAVAHAQVAAIAGTSLILASAGAEHQGPPGSNLVCVVARQRTETPHAH